MEARLVLQLAHDEGGAPAHVALGHVDVGEYVVSCRGSSVNKFVCAHCEYVTRDSERPRTLDAEDRRLRAFGPSRRRDSREPAAVPLDSDQALG